MELNELLDAIIFEEVYEAVKVEGIIHYHPSELSKDIVEKIKADEEFREEYKEEINKQLRRLGHENLEILAIDPSTNCLQVQYTAYYTGSREFPEIHLKTLLVLHEGLGKDIHEPEVFGEIVEIARQGLGEKNRKEKEERLEHFATLFKRAIEKELVVD
jgi:hypothetical protein